MLLQTNRNQFCRLHCFGGVWSAQRHHFTRLFEPAEFGIFVLGTGFAVIASTFMTTWLRLPILREQARDDGTDIRGIIVPGLLLSSLLAPLAYVGTCWPD